MTNTSRRLGLTAASLLLVVVAACSSSNKTAAGAHCEKSGPANACITRRGTALQVQITGLTPGSGVNQRATWAPDGSFTGGPIKADGSGNYGGAPGSQPSGGLNVGTTNAVTLTVEGTRRDGKPFSLTFKNL